MSKISRGLTLLLILDGAWITAGGPGIFQGDTQDTLVMAVLLPYILRDWSLPALFCVTAQVTSPALGAAIVMYVQLLFYFRSWSLLLLSPVVLLHPHILHTKRLEMWGQYMSWWRSHGGILGTGPGSFEWISALLPEKRMWLHNDWLQFIFEQGYIGFTLAVLFYLIIAIRLKFRDDRAFAVWICLGLSMLVYSPIQFFIVQWFGFLLIRRAFHGRYA